MFILFSKRYNCVFDSKLYSAFFSLYNFIKKEWYISNKQTQNLKGNKIRTCCVCCAYHCNHNTHVWNNPSELIYICLVKKSQESANSRINKKCSWDRFVNSHYLCLSKHSARRILHNLGYWTPSANTIERSSYCKMTFI